MNTSIDSTQVFVYFIAAGASPIKIGIAADPMDRLSDLQVAHYKTLRLLFTLRCADRASALELEAAFQRWYANVNIRGEWYDVSPEKIAADIQLLRGLSTLLLEVEQHISPDVLIKLEQRAQVGGTRNPDASRAVETYLDGYQGDIGEIDPLELANLLRVGKSTVYNAIKARKLNSVSQNGHSEL